MTVLNRLGQGREAEVFAWADGYVLKLFWPEFGKADALWEASQTQQVWLTGVAAPRVEDVLEFEGRWGVVMEWASGVPLTDYIQGDAARWRFAAQMLGAVHGQLHAKCAAQLPPQRVALAERIQDSRLEDGLKGRLLDHLAALPDGTSLCHGDFHPENVLIHEGGLSVVDWPNASSGNPLADVARTSLLLLHTVLPADLPARAQIARLRRGFHREYLGSYAEHGPLDAAQLQAWMPVVAAARLREGVEQEERGLMRLIRGGLEAQR